MGWVAVYGVPRVDRVKRVQGGAKKDAKLRAARSREVSLGQSLFGVDRAGVGLVARVADRVCAELKAALRRRPRGEAQLAGALRVLGPLDQNLRAELVEVSRTLLRRGACDRPVYASAIRTLAEAQAPEAVALLHEALIKDGAGGLCSVSAACALAEPSLDVALRRVVVSGQPHLAFAAELARAVRGDSDGQLLMDIAPKIKESHRIALCAELLIPLLHWHQDVPHGKAPAASDRARRALPARVAPALAVLRSTERHLGRWLVLGQTGLTAADSSAVEEAVRQAQAGPISSRPAWALVAWALGSELASGVRPNLELIARLSDRPSADKDTTFLFRLARAQRPEARPLLTGLARGGRPKSPVGVRAALRLAEQYGDVQSQHGLLQLARSSAGDPLRALALAAIADLERAQRRPVESSAKPGAGSSAKPRAESSAKSSAESSAEPSAGPPGTEELAELARELCGARQLRAACWAALAGSAPSRQQPSICEANFRRLEYGWAQ